MILIQAIVASKRRLCSSLQFEWAIAAYFRSPNLPARAHLSDPLQWVWKNSSSKPKRSDYTALNWNRRRPEEENAVQTDSRADGM
jgi:hypothetical protein